MSTMDKFEFNNNIYYYVNNKFVDEHFICLEGEELITVSLYYYNQKDYKSLNKDELLEIIKSIKEAELFAVVKKMCLYALDEYYEDEFTVKTVLPILTSCLRKLKQPKEAIEIAFKYLPEGSSSVLFTSVAAAYCDIMDYENAMRYANRAYALQGGNAGPNELSMVYERIKKEKEKNK